MNNKGKSVHISDTTRLYKQSKSPYWWANIRTDDQQIRKSTKVKVSDDPNGQGKARDKAIELATEIKFKIENGIEIKDIPSLADLGNQVIENLKNRAKQKEIYTDYISVINNYLKPYFKRTAINRVDRHAIYKFYMWREGKTDGISLTQKRVTNKAFTLIFDLACDLGHVKQHEIPKLPKIDTKVSNTKDYFYPDELTKVLKSFDAFISESRNKKTREIRELLQYYTHFLSGSGARPGKEVLTLTYGDISVERINNRQTWLANIHSGKVSQRKGTRKIVLNDRAHDSLEAMAKRLEKGLTLKQATQKHSKKLIFSASYRDTPPDFIKPFELYMKHLGFDNKNHTLYSLRHTYITQALLNGKVPRRAIAKQCGNSEDMIEQYYDHVITQDYAEELKNNDQMPALGAIDLSDFFEK